MSSSCAYTGFHSGGTFISLKVRKQIHPPPPPLNILAQFTRSKYILNFRLNKPFGPFRGRETCCPPPLPQQDQQKEEGNEFKG